VPALDAILEFAAIRRQQAKNFKFPAWRVITNGTRKNYSLADSIFMILHHMNMEHPE
jgi:hypothetical protein